MSLRAGVQQQFAQFAAAVPKNARVAVVGHSDVDGLAATTIITRAFEHLGCSVSPYVTRKGENAWSAPVLEQAAADGPDALAVVDLGSRADPLAPNVPAVLIDHHKPTGVPDGAILISGYGANPTPSSGLLAYWCAEAVGAGDGAAWLAAASMLADYGDSGAFAETKQAAREVGMAVLRRLTTLLNAPRRTASGDANPALRMLLGCSSPSCVLQAENERLLLQAKAEVDEAFARARRTAPVFAADVALITVHESCQVHPLVAQTWRNRLRKQIVICANTGYLPGRVNFAVRTATSRNLLDFLREHRPPGAGEDYGRGHDKATGGSLNFHEWTAFRTSLGFGAA
jgi:single-stranded-DNA-specific exonuclease